MRIATILTFWLNKKDIFGRTNVDILCQIGLVHTQTCANSLQKGLCLQIYLLFQTFYPNFLIFLHGYIHHIRDISQLWAIRYSGSA